MWLLPQGHFADCSLYCSFACHLHVDTRCAQSLQAYAVDNMLCNRDKTILGHISLRTIRPYQNEPGRSSLRSAGKWQREPSANRQAIAEESSVKFVFLSARPSNAQCFACFLRFRLSSGGMSRMSFWWIQCCMVCKVQLCKLRHVLTFQMLSSYEPSRLDTMLQIATQ